MSQEPKPRRRRQAKVGEDRPRAVVTHPLAARLLELHLQQELASLRGERFVQDVREEVAALMGLLGRTRLKDWVSPDQIMGVIRRNVIELKISGGITELAGDMANQVFRSKVHRSARLSDIMNARQFEEFVEKIISLKAHRQRVLRRILAHPVYAELISDLLYEGIRHYLSRHSMLSDQVPGMGSALKFGRRMMDRMAPNLDSHVKAFIAKNARRFVQRSETFLNETLSDEALKETIMDFWDVIENKTLKEFQRGMDELDLSEFVVLIYEFWLRFRTTDYFERACRVVVEGIYEKYGSEPVTVWLEDMGVSQDMILAEVEALAPPALELLHRTGYLEQRLRHRLEGFYASEEVARLLASGAEEPADSGRAAKSSRARKGSSKTKPASPE